VICENGFRADGDRCVKIACRAGYRLNDDGECEKVQEKKPVARRDDATKRDAERKSTETAVPKAQSSGQIVCGQAGCRPVAKGCRLEYGTFGGRFGSAASNKEVCN
jgi:hypothetical protein